MCIRDRLEDDLLSAFFQRALDQRLVREFVRKCPGAFRPAREQVLNHGRMAPGEEPVKVLKLHVEIVVLLGRDDDDIAAVSYTHLDVYKRQRQE